MPTKTALQKRLKEIDELIRETEARLPAHSAKPPVMAALFALEDEKEAILAKLKGMSGKPTESGNVE